MVVQERADRCVQYKEALFALAAWTAFQGDDGIRWVQNIHQQLTVDSCDMLPHIPSHVQVMSKDVESELVTCMID